MVKNIARESKYAVPACLTDVDQKVYAKWIQRKAKSHFVRDRKRGLSPQSVSAYKQKIHTAVERGGNKDFYSNDVLDWSLISTYSNELSAKERSAYKATHGRLPTVDHTINSDGELDFVICSWAVNDMKNDLPENDFYDLCARILKHRENQSSAKLRT